MMEPRKYSTGTFKAVQPCTVGIATKTGSRYDFPDMSKPEIFKVIGPQLFRSENMVLVNISGACLTIPVRIIDSIAIDGEVTWRSGESPSTP